MRRCMLWSVAAVAGVLLVAAITAAASTLSTQTIGLSSEPLTAGDQLAPRATATPAKRKPPRPRRTPTPTPRPVRTATPAATAVPPVATVDDNSGHGGGSDDSGGGDSGGHGSGGHGSDD